MQTQNTTPNTIDLPLEIMKLAVIEGSSFTYKTHAEKLAKRLNWSKKKLTRVLNNTDSLTPIEEAYAKIYLKESSKERRIVSF